MANKLAELRNRVSAIVRKLSNDGASSKDVVAQVHEKHPELVRDATPNLVDIALVKIVNDVKRRRPKGATSGQLELFSEYSVPGLITLRVETAGQTHFINKALARATYPEVEQHVADHSKPRAKISNEVKELRRMLDDLKDFRTALDMTIEDMWAARLKFKKES